MARLQTIICGLAAATMMCGIGNSRLSLAATARRIPVKIQTKPHARPATKTGGRMMVPMASMYGISHFSRLFDRLPDIGERTRCPEIELVFLRASFWERMPGQLNTDSNPALYVADCLSLQGRYGEAESVYRRALAIYEAAQSARHTNVPGRGAAHILTNLAILLEAQSRFAEAEPLFQRALSIEELLGSERPDTATALNNSAVFLNEHGRYAEAEPLFRRALSVREKALGQDHAETANSLNSLGGLLLAQGAYSEAESLYRRAIAIFERVVGPMRADTATALSNLGFCLYLQGRYAEAEPVYQRALAIRESVLRPDHPDTVGLRENIARNFAAQMRFGEAIANFRVACAARFSAGSGHNLSGDAAQVSRKRANGCATDYSLSLWSWAAAGGGTESSDRPDALMVEAFVSSQHAAQSAAGDAIARSAALTAANSSGVGDEALDYEAALLERSGVDLQFATVEGYAGSNTIESRQALEKAHEEIMERITRLEAAVRAKAPLYWDYRSADPIGIAALQAKSGPDSVLLRDDEALITFLIAPGKAQGLVFAADKNKVAWAKIKMTGDVLKNRIARLRAQIDPHGYQLRGVENPNNASAGNGPNPWVFSRQSAYELYEALLGDEAIQQVTKDKALLLFVPSGPLTSLPPGLLITSPPAGGAERDSDPRALRETAWLLRSKAVALLPAVSSLRTLRQILPAKRGSTSDPLLAFVDPDFAREASSASPGDGATEVRGLGSYYRGGLPLSEALARLPALPGTRSEGEALQQVLGAKSGSVLMGKEASKAQLMARNSDGRLAQVRVLEFATHGLVAGDAADLAEPALVLAAGVKPEDELLRASEAAALTLNADWVLLSACNTASPDAPGAEGLSGLTRAFFYAGARSLLVSHWRVRDDVAKLLIPAMMLAQHGDPQLSHAEALRKASLAILDNPELGAANPSDWAPFTIVGEAGK
jgi:CHAT domain-containing protein/Flp pilus assembly protein TadD